mmetsp:Transcript_712/g.1619  ORF Transcript_712/g.1619 Transcript_712/m.1619 type:complete len:213 (+) Transcript_712:57-695(+)|eukprot:CAMPEP_0114516502 /NCGR_PEP_ID=MMETSP0109-20121206/17363_1 /TAXON_ID=29199 /ORGANISM="Chlorarachnion reptans, Strain CCCM449" /LENGTH=212 /DNA_ID=CAMNT_0001696897 /DNA_START=120 /DNA_END=758 /DNA_ORIENTATION=+
MGSCCSSADHQDPPKTGGVKPEPKKAETKEIVQQERNDEKNGASKQKTEQDREEDMEAFNKLKASIIQGWTHIMSLITDKIFQDFALEIGYKTYFEITPHKPMENFFRKCLAFKDPQFEVPGVDLDNENSIDHERKKFQVFLNHVAKTDFKKSISLDEIEEELNKAVKVTVEGFEESIAKAKEKGRTKITQDLEIFAQIFRYLLDDEDEDGE